MRSAFEADLIFIVLAFNRPALRASAKQNQVRIPATPFYCVEPRRARLIPVAGAINSYKKVHPLKDCLLFFILISDVTLRAKDYYTELLVL